MKERTKRILCGVLSLLAFFTVAVVGVLHSSANNTALQGTTVTAGASFKNVTGQLDTSKPMDSFLHESILKAEDVAPMLDYTVFEVVQNTQDASVLEDARGCVPVSVTSGEVEPPIEEQPVPDDEFDPILLIFVVLCVFACGSMCVGCALYLQKTKKRKQLAVKVVSEETEDDEDEEYDEDDEDEEYDEDDELMDDDDQTDAEDDEDFDDEE